MFKEPEHLELPEGGGPLVIGVAGGSGSGKTTISNAIVEQIGPDQVALVEHDAYYREYGSLPLEERAKVNFDHPDSLETELLIEHLRSLINGQPIEKPVYDFTTHSRLPQTVTVKPKPTIVVDGILVLMEKELRELMDLKIYVDTDSDLRVLRRLQRDIEERDRTLDSVITQYLSTVRPMHLQFVEPSKRYADIIIPEGYNRQAVATVMGMVREYLRQG
ncbi:MAG: uridine kinase [Acidimicrobiia bacterium]|nr:uridine kinase [Acidimicrobiia bacterium]MDH3397765.1 uridine kinase [Acidimicrobiia bacterium]MDH5615518.1 uridine kinase [Acidimicrobiia bacterium]